MGIGNLLHAFFEDTRTQIALLLVILDVVLGVIAVFVDDTQGFRLSYIADFLRTDVLGKVLPFFVLYGGYKYAAGADIVIPGFDLEVLMNAAWGIVLLALGGSLLKSLSDLGLFKGEDAPQVAGQDPVTPTVPAPPNP